MQNICERTGIPTGYPLQTFVVGAKEGRSEHIHEGIKLYIGKYK
jgi:hypothetical protein